MPESNKTQVKQRNQGNRITLKTTVFHILKILPHMSLILSVLQATTARHIFISTPVIIMKTSRSIRIPRPGYWCFVLFLLTSTLYVNGVCGYIVPQKHKQLLIKQTIGLQNGVTALLCFQMYKLTSRCLGSNLSLIVTLPTTHPFWSSLWMFACTPRSVLGLGVCVSWALFDPWPCCLPCHRWTLFSTPFKLQWFEALT